MKTGTILLIGGAALAAYYFEQLGVAGATVQILFDGVQIKSLTKFTAQFRIQNVSNASVIVRALTGDITLNGSEVGNISMFDEYDIPATGQKVISVDFTPNLLALPQTVINAINNSGGNLNFQVTGNMNVNTLVLPFSLQEGITV